MRQWLKITLLVIVVYLVWYLLKRGAMLPPIEPFQAPALAITIRESVEQRRLVAVPTTIKCPMQMIGTNRQFLCESEEEATKLIAGPTNKQETYFGPQDQVCVTDDKESGIYTCKDLNQSPDDPDDYRFTAYDNYEKTCDNIVKSYLDLSSNLVSLNAMKDVVLGSTTGVDSAKTNLNTLFLNMKCSLSPSGRTKTICDAIKGGLDELNKQGVLTDSTLRQVTDPIQKMIDSRSSLKKSIDDFRCDLS